MERTPFNFISINPCNGEVITFNGVLRSMVKEHTTPSGTVHNNIHFYLHGQGVGDQGNEYVYNDIRIFVANANKQSEISSNFSLLIISKGPAPNYMLHAVLHTTFNANGEVTAVVEILKEECRG
ncbi:hypothetical protein [Niallia sp. Krafla_26]|uniref:hypothetical protein n=1 Tax=Niallia sp. Krafla_26 TaxID=3064703 RepID=UPI003D163A65